MKKRKQTQRQRRREVKDELEQPSKVKRDDSTIESKQDPRDDHADRNDSKIKSTLGKDVERNSSHRENLEDDYHHGKKSDLPSGELRLGPGCP